MISKMLFYHTEIQKLLFYHTQKYMIISFFFGFFFFFGLFLLKNLWNGWICRFEWLNLYNESVLKIFQHAESIYAFRNAI
jgi:hypothetical protein